MKKIFSIASNFLRRFPSFDREKQWSKGNCKMSKENCNSCKNSLLWKIVSEDGSWSVLFRRISTKMEKSLTENSHYHVVLHNFHWAIADVINVIEGISSMDEIFWRSTERCLDVQWEEFETSLKKIKRNLFLWTDKR